VSAGEQRDGREQPDQPDQPDEPDRPDQRDEPAGPLEQPDPVAAAVTPEQEPPASTGGREREWIDHDPTTRDIRPAIGTRGGPAPWNEGTPGADVALARRGFGDAQWSFLYKAGDTTYGAEGGGAEEIAAANRAMRSAPVPELQGPFIKAPVWTWEVPLYFWVGGVASGAAFVALACDVAGDAKSARIARTVALGAVTPAPLLLIADLGRPERFLNMLRIVKPRSPMNMGAWCLFAFSGTLAGAVGADLVKRPRAARVLGGATAALGGYLGSYTGVLLACTAVPLWARSRAFLGPIFVTTATATGAAATRLALVASGLPKRHPTRTALGTLETASMLTELALSAINERHAGSAGGALTSGSAGRTYRLAQALVFAGLSTRVVGRRSGESRLHDAASVMYLAAGLAFRFAWIQAGRASAADHEAVVTMARGRDPLDGAGELPKGAREPSQFRSPMPLGGLRRLWGEAVRRASLAVERRVRS
jgi:formate-dependent nitrite reductase membrane component NrfD